MVLLVTEHKIINCRWLHVLRISAKPSEPWSLQYFPSIRFSKGSVVLVVIGRRALVSAMEANSMRILVQIRDDSLWRGIICNLHSTVLQTFWPQWDEYIFILHVNFISLSLNAVKATDSTNGRCLWRKTSAMHFSGVCSSPQLSHTVHESNCFCLRDFWLRFSMDTLYLTMQELKGQQPQI